MHRYAVDPDENPWFPIWFNFVVGNHLLANGNTQRAQPFFEESYSAFIAYHDAMTEAQRQIWLSFRGWYAALAGDPEAALEYRESGLAYAAVSNDILSANRLRQAAALVLAILGDTDAAWHEFEPLIGVPGGVTQWDLALRIDYRYFLADSEGYQAMVADLETR